MPKPTKQPDSAELVERDERAPLMREGTVRIVPREEVAARAEGDAPATRAEEGETEIEIAISSESAVERYDWMTGRTYKEILGHGAGEIDLSYAKDGLPFFVNHSSRDMVGLIEDVRLDPDRVLRGRVRFSKSARAAEIRQDILDGIRKKISVGYDYPEDNYTEKAENDELSRRYTGWRPLEASSVPIPADYEVGVGRSARPGARRPDDLPGATASKAKEQTMGTSAQPAADAGAVAVATRAQIAAEHAEIVAIAKQHKLESRLADWIGAQASIEQVRLDVLEHYRKKSEEVVTRGGQGKVLDLSGGDERRYSFARAIQSAAAGEQSYERELSEELYKKLGKRRSRENAMLVPTQLLGRAMQERAMAVATSGSGQQLRFDEYGGFLDILRNRMYVGRFGATFLSGLQGDLSFVTKPSTNTFQWGAETANPTATNFGTGLKVMAPKNGQALTAYTRQLLAQSVESIEGLVQNDLLGIIAIALDAAAIVAGGGSAPVGIIGTTGIGAVAMGTNGGAATFNTFVDLWTQIAIDNADAAAMKYLTTVGVAGAMQKTQQFSGTNGVPIWSWDGGAGPGEGRVNGHVAAATNQVPSNLTKGTSTAVCHAAIFGDWPSLVIGEWGAVEILVDPYSSKMAIIEVGAHLMADVCLRYPEKFSACLDITV